MSTTFLTTVYDTYEDGKRINKSSILYKNTQLIIFCNFQNYIRVWTIRRDLGYLDSTFFVPIPLEEMSPIAKKSLKMGVERTDVVRWMTFEFMHQGSRLNPFNTPYFVWIDKDVDTSEMSNPFLRPENASNCIRLPLIGYTFPYSPVYLLDQSKFRPTFSNKIFGGSQIAINEMNLFVSSAVAQLLAKGRIVPFDHILSLVHASNPDILQWYPSDESDVVVNFGPQITLPNLGKLVSDGIGAKDEDFISKVGTRVATGLITGTFSPKDDTLEIILEISSFLDWPASALKAITMDFALRETNPFVPQKAYPKGKEEDSPLVEIVASSHPVTVVTSILTEEDMFNIQIGKIPSFPMVIITKDDYVPKIKEIRGMTQTPTRVLTTTSSELYISKYIAQESQEWRKWVKIEGLKIATECDPYKSSGYVWIDPNIVIDEATMEILAENSVEKLHIFDEGKTPIIIGPKHATGEFCSSLLEVLCAFSSITKGPIPPLEDIILDVVNVSSSSKMEEID